MIYCHNSKNLGILKLSISISLTKCSRKWCYWKWGPGACHSKANTREARLVEKKVCFILEAGNRGGGGGGRRASHVQRPTPRPRQTVDKSFYRWRQGAICPLQQLSSNRSCHCLTSIILIVLSTTILPGLVCFHFFEASSQNCGSLCHGYNLVIM